MVRKTVHISISDDMFSTYAPKTYMENMPCELALRSNSNPALHSQSVLCVVSKNDLHICCVHVTFVNLFYAEAT